MQRHFKKLLIGKGRTEDVPRRSVIERRWENITAIWNNEFDEDSGLEKVVRLALAASQFLFPGMYIRQLFWRRGPQSQDLATEVFVLLKTTFPAVALHQGWEHQPIVLFLVVWFMLETVIYIPTLIFASDTFSSPRSYRRSQILILLNYVEVVFTFGVIYASGNYLNKAFTHWADPIYFSFVTNSTIGFGEYFPVTPMGKAIVCLQSLFYLSYIVLFINFFTVGRQRGYFSGRRTE